jgi:hypothetical protein
VETVNCRGYGVQLGVGDCSADERLARHTRHDNYGTITLEFGANRLGRQSWCVLCKQLQSPPLALRLRASPGLEPFDHGVLTADNVMRHKHARTQCSEVGGHTGSMSPFMTSSAPARLPIRAKALAGRPRAGAPAGSVPAEMMLNVAMVLGEGEQEAGPWRVVSLAELVGMLGPDERAPAGRPWVLAVDGRSGSGKTTLAGRIRDAVPASMVVHTDDVAWSQAMFDWADLLAGGILEPRRAGEFPASRVVRAEP